MKNGERGSRNEILALYRVFCKTICMKCPYPECRKDYNEGWESAYDDFVSPDSFDHSSDIERGRNDRLHVITRECRFCGKYFHSVSVGREIVERNPWNQVINTTNELIQLVTFPVSKTKFEAATVPVEVRDSFNEAERCRSVGSITGSGACLRKAVYALCDAQKASGADYKEKIGNLPVRDEGHKELLKQFKWLGDNVTKPGLETYTVEMLDAALEILPLVVDDMYLKKENAEKTSKLLAKTRAANPKEQD